jgi:S1-C subfamily serine protease
MRFDSDHAPFYRKKIPVMFAFAGWHEDYHRPSDDVDKIDYDGAMGIMQLLQGVADDIIEADQRPTYQEVENSSRRGRGRQLDLKVRMGFRPGAPDGDESSGISVETVVDGGPADQAGVRAGDVIIAINKTPVESFMDYVKAVKPFKPGDQTDVTVRRGDREVTLKVTFAGRD